MPKVVTSSIEKPDAFEKHTGAEPLPGYRLLAPLGRGGFGEVWKCEAPGGLHKAIKFVAADGERFRQELAAFEQIKSIRHPFLLGIDRVELSGGELVMVMELADCQLNDRFRVCKSEGRRGVPREELVGYLEEVAESLDMIGTQYGLQHLDVKPENLFLVAGHAKIGDYGLVRRAERVKAKVDDNRGFTPRYTAPEVLLGRVDTRSDQYSLALVYVELLTGIFPYSGRTAQQLMLQHIHHPPDLSELSQAELPIVQRALSKDPSSRFPSCSEFVKALSRTSESGRNERPRETAKLLQEESVSTSCDQTIASSPWTVAAAPSRHSQKPREAEQLELPHIEENVRPSENATIVSRQPIAQRNKPATRTPAHRRAESPPVDPFEGLETVMPVDVHRSTILRGSAGRALLAPEAYVDLVVQMAAENAGSGAVHEELEGVLTARFLSTLPVGMVPLKLAMVAERWDLSLRQVDQTQFSLFREFRVDPRKLGKSDARVLLPQRRSGLEVIVSRPLAHSGELCVLGGLCGVPDEEFARKAHEDLPAIIDQIRGHLQNLAERRAYPRYQTDMPIRVYPLYPDGLVGTAIGGRCQDISLGGIRFVTPTPVWTERIYVEFHEVQEVCGQAVYVRILRSWQEVDSQKIISAARFRPRA